MNYYSLTLVISSIYFTTAEDAAVIINDVFKQMDESKCEVNCPSEDQSMECGFDMANTVYKMFPSTCAMAAYSKCYNIVYARTPLEFCVKSHNDMIVSRRFYGESCPVFCPSHYRPVCGASKVRSYNYRAFTNGCYMDMLNCRGEDEEMGYVEVPLSFCQNHAMKNIFKEQVLFGGVNDYRTYE